jgi:hypothetical protein
MAGPVTGAVARLANGPGGLTPGRAGLAPAGQLTKFHGGIATSYPLRPALPGRTEFPMRCASLERGKKPSSLCELFLCNHYVLVTNIILKIREL